MGCSVIVAFPNHIHLVCVTLFNGNVFVPVLLNPNISCFENTVDPDQLHNAFNHTNGYIVLNGIVGFSMVMF